jgi:hypothetical protein
LLAGSAAVLAGHAHTLVAALGDAALIDDQDALGVAEGFIDPAEQLGAERQVRPGRLADEVLGHADLRGIAAVGVAGNRFGVLVIVGVEQQAAQVGFGPSHTGVVFQERTKPAHERVKRGNACCKSCLVVSGLLASQKGFQVMGGRQTSKTGPVG